MCSSKLCWRNERRKDLCPTCAPCRDFWPWRHEARPFAWCWQRRSLARNPITNSSDSAWGPRASSRPNAGVSPMAPCAIRCSAPCRKNLLPTRSDRNRLLDRQAQTLLARSRLQTGHPDPPSPPARFYLQPLPARTRSSSCRMSTEP